MVKGPAMHWLLAKDCPWILEALHSPCPMAFLNKAIYFIYPARRHSHSSQKNRSYTECNIIMRVAYDRSSLPYSIGQKLLLTLTRQCSTFSQGEGILKRCKHQEVKIIGDHLWVLSPQLHLKNKVE